MLRASERSLLRCLTVGDRTRYPIRPPLSGLAQKESGVSVLIVVGTLPDALQRLVAALEAMGFSVIAEQYSEAHFGNQLLELADPSRETGNAVRLVKDRGLWSVEIALAGRWRGPYEVLLAIDGARYSSRALSHEERLRFTLKALERIPPTDSIQPVIDRLAEFDREYQRRFVKDD